MDLCCSTRISSTTASTACSGWPTPSTLRIFEQIPGQVLLSYVAEDMGGQASLMMSCRHIREFLLPRMKRMIDLAHSAGAYVFHHNDGNCRAILPDLIAGRHRCAQPDPVALAGHGPRGAQAATSATAWSFTAAMDNQYTLPFGTVDEVRQEVLDNLRILGAGGGYILAPCHNIQAITPPENVVAMYETGYEHGWN